MIVLKQGTQGREVERMVRLLPEQPKHDHPAQHAMEARAMDVRELCQARTAPCAVTQVIGDPQLNRKIDQLRCERGLQMLQQLRTRRKISHGHSPILGQESDGATVLYANSVGQYVAI